MGCLVRWICYVESMTDENLVVSDLEPAATAAAAGRSAEEQVRYSIAVSLKRIADHFEREAPPRRMQLKPSGLPPRN